MNKKIIMIGPVYPYKTGLSYYVTLLYKQLRLNHDVLLISYSMQYPWILYRKPQKDYTDKTLSVEDALFILNTANPLNWIKTARYIRKQKPDFVILQWLHPYFAPCYCSLIKLLDGVDFLYICHNVFPHERFFLDKWLTKKALQSAQYFITHSKSDAEDLRSMVSNKKIEVAVHPTYNFFCIKNLSKQNAREQLQIGRQEKVLLFFGLVREYKGLRYLIDAMGLLKHQMEIKLLVAGDFGGHLKEYEEIICKNGVKNNVIITNRHLKTFEVEKFFVACDLVVLPYVSATQSGVIQVAYGFEKPVIATRVGGLPDVVKDGETGYLVEPETPSAIADAVKRFFAEKRSKEFEDNIRKNNERFSWDRMQEVIERLAFA